MTFRDKPAGMVRLTVAPPAADFVLAPVLADFFAQYPEITLEVAVSGALSDIVADRFDAGIRSGERLERDMIAVRVSDPIPFAVVASPSYLARRGVPKTPQDLMAHNCIRLRFPSGAIFPWHFQTKHEVFEAQIGGTLIVGDSAALAVKAAVNGVGLLQLSPKLFGGGACVGRACARAGRMGAATHAGIFPVLSLAGARSGRR